VDLALQDEVLVPGCLRVDAVCVRFGRLLVNLLHVSAAREQLERVPVASREAGLRFQLSVWVDDVDAVCALLEHRGATLLSGPVD
jgi:lactoylglutathione lyase